MTIRANNEDYKSGYNKKKLTTNFTFENKMSGKSDIRSGGSLFNFNMWSINYNIYIL